MQTQTKTEAAASLTERIDDVEAHRLAHAECERCEGQGDIPDHSDNDGGTRLCPAEPAISPKAADRVRLKRPLRLVFGGRERFFRVAQVAEVLNDGRCFGLRFAGYPNTVDIGFSMIAEITNSARPRA